jgi:hypothetical protein
MTAETGLEPEPRWPAAIALFGAAVLPLALPRSLILAPALILVPTNVVLLSGAVLAHNHNRNNLTDFFSYSNLGLLTLSMLYSLATLVIGLLHHNEPAPMLLRSAAILWFANVIVGAAWYWRLDAGGPRARDGRKAHMEGAFLFPQMAVEAPGRKGMSLAEAEGWRPGFIDYLAISFYTCTAFSPTDVQVLTRWGKMIMMVQAGTAFGTVILLTARAVNII